MTNKEIKEKIEELENKIFMNMMIDHWTQANYERDEELNKEIIKLERMLKDN